MQKYLYIQIQKTVHTISMQAGGMCMLKYAKYLFSEYCRPFHLPEKSVLLTLISHLRDFTGFYTCGQLFFTRFWRWEKIMNYKLDF